LPGDVRSQHCQLNLRDLEVLFNSSIQALTQAGVFGPTVAGSPNAAELETTQGDAAFYGTPAHGRQANCRGFQARPINVVVVHAWQGRDYGPSGKPVFRTIAAVGKPWRSFDDYNDRRLVEHCCIKETKQQWAWGHVL
jgi:hypothetical protein